MNLDLSQDQEMMRETFSRFLNENSSPARVRAALPGGFDRALWTGLAELGAFSLRVPASRGGLGLSLLDAAVLMEEAGRTLVSGPLAETLIVSRLLAVLGDGSDGALLGRVAAGKAVVGIAFADIAREPVQWVAGGAVAEAVIACKSEQVVLIPVPEGERKGEPNLASTPIARLRIGDAPGITLSSGPEGVHAFAQALEEWKLLMAAALSGLAHEAIRLAAAYARERVAFGQPIGAYQGISHPLADLICDVDGGKYLTWKAIRDIADNASDAGAEISLAAWWSADSASRAVAQALHTFGGYGLTTDYDIHLYNLRAKAWPLVFGDPARFLEEAGRRLYAGERASLPEPGEVVIDFDIGEEARKLAHEVDAFFRQNLTPELKAKAHYSWDGHDAGIHRKLAEARLLFLGWPEELGGRVAPAYARHAAYDVWQEHGWTTAPMSVAGMVGTIIQRFGSDELKREVLAKVARGDALCSLGYSEPSAGSDVFAARTRATREGDFWRIDGQKMFTSGSNFTDFVLLLARTDPEAPKHQGLTMFIVPLKAKGIEIKPVFTFQDERTNISYYDGVRIPDSYRLGEVNKGVKVMSASLELEHGGGFAPVQRRMVLAAEQCSREIHRDGEALMEKPSVQVRLARASAHTLLAEIISLRALWAGVNKKPNLAYGPMAKLFSSEKFLKDSSDLLDLTAPDSLAAREGPAGFLNQCYRHAQGTTIYGGTSEIHRSLIAERALGLPLAAAAEGATMSEPAHLLTEDDGAILIATLNRPDKLNALSGETMRLFEAALHRFRDTPSLKVMLVRARGRYFCAGADLRGGGEDGSGRATTASGIRESHRLKLNGMHRIYDEMEAMEKPLVVAHHAPCVGGGLELSMSCDFRLAAKGASYAFPEGKFGVLPASNGVSRLTRIVGTHWSRYLIMANMPVVADKALIMGLVHEVWPDETFEEEVMRFCRHLAQQNGEQMGAAKLAIEMARDVGLAQGRNVERMANSALMLNPDYRAGVEKYIQGIGGKGESKDKGHS